MISISSQIRRALINLDRGRGGAVFLRLVDISHLGHRRQHRVTCAHALATRSALGGTPTFTSASNCIGATSIASGRRISLAKDQRWLHGGAVSQLMR